MTLRCDKGRAVTSVNRTFVTTQLGALIRLLFPIRSSAEKMQRLGIEKSLTGPACVSLSSLLERTLNECNASSQRETKVMRFNHRRRQEREREVIVRGTLGFCPLLLSQMLKFPLIS